MIRPLWTCVAPLLLGCSAVVDPVSDRAPSCRRVPTVPRPHLLAVVPPLLEVTRNSLMDGQFNVRIAGLSSVAVGQPSTAGTLM
jgi:hypothetical protein